MIYDINIQYTKYFCWYEGSPFSTIIAPHLTAFLMPIIMYSRILIEIVTRSSKMHCIFIILCMDRSKGYKVLKNGWGLLGWEMSLYFQLSISSIISVLSRIGKFPLVL